MEIINVGQRKCWLNWLLMFVTIIIQEWFDLNFEALMKSQYSTSKRIDRLNYLKIFNDLKNIYYN